MSADKSKNTAIQISVNKIFLVVFGLMSLIFPWMKIQFASEGLAISFVFDFAGNPTCVECVLFSPEFKSARYFNLWGALYFTGFILSLFRWRINGIDKNYIISIIGTFFLVISFLLWILMLFLEMAQVEGMSSIHLLLGFYCALATLVFALIEEFSSRKYMITIPCEAIVSNRKQDAQKYGHGFRSENREKYFVKKRQKD